MKQLDRLMITSFFPPFLVTFMIAMFVLVMQVLWLYIDDIAGKGLGFFLIIELLAYKCVSLIPMALPLAVLISSVMVLGNLAERYELSSFKSAGVSLWRIMRPMMFFAAGAMAFSFFCSNNLIPVANLKFGSRMYDIQRQKPALRLDAGIFNDDFDGYAIHIGKKAPDGKHIERVLIYDHTDASKGNLSQIIAESGEMYATEDGAYFVMNLNKGHQYMETEPSASGSSRSFPFVRTNFSSWNKVFDLSEFQLNRTNEELFKSNRSMLTSGQLQEAIDSLGIKIERRQISVSNQMANFFYFMEVDSTYLGGSDEDEDGPPPQEQETEATQQETDSQPEASESADNAGPDAVPVSVVGRAGTPSPNITAARRKFEGNPLDQQIDKPLEEYEHFYELFKKADQRRLRNKAKSFVRSIHAHSESAMRSLDRLMESQVKHIYELHTKYSMAVICFIFLFIGAPMGAIVRKGGFGYPILISIIFFMLFIVLTIFCRKIAETFVLPAAAAAWIPCSVLFPIGLFLTVKAMNDSKLINPDRLLTFLNKISKRRKQ
ncbi:MAG: LptF/LptG family permease [Phaeodactylibacter sp.]|nr:LptF/LptG family permease [Phaeodactylibacter sp.]MCB9051865.1 LptF/LptG family permease [Lewinellaceae bacterium]